MISHNTDTGTPTVFADTKAEAVLHNSTSRGYVLLSVIVFGFLMLIGVDILFRNLIEDLNKQAEDEQSRLLIGEMILNDLVRIESDVYKMATTSGIRGQEIIKTSLLSNLDQLGNSLDVLEHGGTLRRATRVNIESSEEIIREVTYHGFNRHEYVLEVIDLKPKLSQIRLQVDELAHLLALRETKIEEGNSHELSMAIRNVMMFLRKIPPLFTRMNENAARLFVYSQNQKLVLDDKTSNTKLAYTGIEITIALSIMIAVTAFGYILLRRISESSHKLHQSNQAILAASRKAEAASRAKSEFLSSMSHELRTPLNAVLGFAQLMEMEAKTDSERDNVNEILKAGRHLLELINEVLDLAKIETGRIQLSIEPVEVHDVVNECLALTAPLATRRSISISAVDMDRRLSVKADRTRLKQILLNLLSNAVKYNRDGGKVLVTLAFDAESSLKIIISDTGQGIPEHFRHQLFEPFNRLGAESGNIEGTGIGLAISRKLVHLMDGDIGYEPREQEGSHFWLRLPTIAANNLAISELQSKSSDDEKSRKQLATILYIEDNPANLRLVNQLLSRKPWIGLLTAHEPYLGIEIALNNTLDLILLDINLPGIDGYEVLDRLRKNDQTRHLPIIALTANAMPSDIEHGIAAGFTAYMTKPINVTEFYATLDKYIPPS